MQEEPPRRGDVPDWTSDSAALRVLMAAGGTGGHIFPALAVAEELRARSVRRNPENPNCAIQFIGTGRGLESRVVQNAGFSFVEIAGAGLKGVAGWKRIRNFLVLPRSTVETESVFRLFQPSVVVGMGGYAAGPAMLKAALKGIPTLLIEPNAVPGFTNRVLGPIVRRAALGFGETARFYGSRAHVTGNPVRRAFLQIAPKMHAAPFTILILGGSQGSAAINRCVMESLPLLATEAQRMSYIHQTGERDYTAVGEAYKNHGIPAEVYTFIDDVPQAFSRADLIVSRAGATTVAELAAAGKAALLIPFPAATDHHQRENARAMQRAGGARMIEQAELTPARFVREVSDLVGRPERLVEMERGARTQARPHAAEDIAELVENLAWGTDTTSN